MARLAKCGIDRRAARSVAGSSGGIRRRSRSIESPWLRPTFTHSSDDRINLFFREHSARALSEGRHRRSRNSIRGRATQDRVVCNRQIHRVSQSDRGASPSLGSVTTRAVFAIQNFEVRNFIRGNRRAGSNLFSRRIGTPAQYRGQPQCCGYEKAGPHLDSSLPRFSSMIPGVSTPARTAKGKFSAVGTRSCRTTTTPATTPKAT